jgi:hypothetical protein
VGDASEVERLRAELDGAIEHVRALHYTIEAHQGIPHGTLDQSARITRSALAVGEGEATPAPSGGEIAMRMIHAFCEVTEPTIVKAGDICGDWDCLDADDVMFVVHPPTDEKPWVEDVRAPILAEPVETCGAEGWEEGRTRRCSLPPGHGWVHDWARPPAAPVESVVDPSAGGTAMRSRPRYGLCADHEPVVDPITGRASATCRCNPLFEPVPGSPVEPETPATSEPTAADWEATGATWDDPAWRWMNGHAAAAGSSGTWCVRIGDTYQFFPSEREALRFVVACQVAPLLAAPAVSPPVEPVSTPEVTEATDDR